MDWLILILGVPAILIPLVLLFGFAGCAAFASTCADDSDCPGGTICTPDGLCVDAAVNPLPPENLAAIALDNRSVSLTWTNTDPAATDFRIERAEDGEDFDAIAPEDLEDVSSTGATDVSDDLQEGVTYIYQVRALLGQEASLPSDTSSATVFPAAPVNLVATAASSNEIDLSWDNESAIATDFVVERRDPGGGFEEHPDSPVSGTTFQDLNNLDEGTRYEYRVSAVVNGVENNVAQEVKSAASAIASATTLAFTAVFTAPPGTLINEGSNVGFCLVQRLGQTLLTPSGTTPTQVRIGLRGPLTGSLTLDLVTISQPADSQPGATGTEDPYDAAPDLTEVASGVTIAANTSVTVGPVNYTLDFTQDLLVAFDVSNISNTPGEGNVSFGALPGAHAFSNPNPPGTPDARVPDRAPNYANDAPDTLALVEIIEVL